MTPASADTPDTIEVDLHPVIYALSDSLDRLGIMAAACAQALGKSTLAEPCPEAAAQTP